jgi:hypothetical protein
MESIEFYDYIFSNFFIHVFITTLLLKLVFTSYLIIGTDIIEIC